MTLIWEGDGGKERFWAGSKVAILEGKMEENKIMILQPMTSYHIVKVHSMFQFKYADVTRLVSCDAVAELCMQLRRAASAMGFGLLSASENGSDHLARTIPANGGEQRVVWRPLSSGVLNCGKLFPGPAPS